MKRSDQLRKTIKAATELLQINPRTTYTQQAIVERLEWVGYKVSPSLFNVVLNQKEKGSLSSLQKIRDGLDEIIRVELGYYYDEEDGSYIKSDDPNIVLRRITRNGLIEEVAEQINNVKVYSAGRLSLEEKVAFMQDATEEVIFFGVRLRQFASYFTGKKMSDFGVHISGLLDKGVRVRAYMLDPNWDKTSIYFDDRSSALEQEKYSLQSMDTIVKELKFVSQQYNTSKTSSAALEIFTYRHFPQGYYLVVDGHLPNGKMQFAPYLFGLSRSESPVQEILKQDQALLFDKYWCSLQSLIAAAAPLI
ncbi:MAG: hypothetical protein AAGI49_09265 [Bacteroidota bacterium]